MSLSRSLDMINARVPDWKIEWYVSLDSTQLEAIRLLVDRPPHRTAIVATEQTGGLGRLGRTWHSAPGDGLYVSMILRLDLPAAQLPAFTLAMGLAVKEAIEKTTSLECDLRWPNDVLCNGRKVSGILCQYSDGAIIAGVGINVNHTEFPKDLAGTATSLHLEGAGTFSREDLFVALLDAVDSYATRYAIGDRDTLLLEFVEQSSSTVGMRATAEQQGETIHGYTEGLDEQGFLMMRRHDGSRVTILAGGVRPDVTGD